MLTPLVGDAQLKREIEQLRGTRDQYQQIVGTIDQAKTKTQELADRTGAQGTMDQLETKLADMREKEEEYDALQLYLTQINDRVAEAQAMCGGERR